jgi:amino acid transporter
MLLVYCFIFYISALVIHILGGKIFWRMNIILTILSIGPLLIYILGSIPFCDFVKNASSPSVTGGDKKEWFVGEGVQGFSTFFTYAPLSAWFYVGVESLNLGAAFVQKVQ